MAASPSPLRGRIHYIDGLRAVAVLGVLVHHAAKYDVGIPDGVLRHALLEGAHGVDLFFVISGFVLSYPTLLRLHAEGGASFDVAKYLAHRFVRILPPYYFAIGVGLIVLYAVGAFALSIPTGIIGPQMNAFDVVKQLIFMDQRTQLLNGAFWSLAVEFRWYFLFPLLLLLWTKSKRAFGLVALAFIFLSYFPRAGSLDVVTLPTFMLGIVAADIEIRQLPIRRLGVLLLILALVIAVATEPKQKDFATLIPQLGWQIAPFFLVVAAGAAGWLRKTLSFAPIVWIGIISYSVYLVHEWFVGLVLTNTEWGFFGAVAAGLAGGAVFWLIFERPFMATALKGKLTGALWGPLNRALVWLGIPSEFRLGQAPAKAEELPHEALVN